MPTNTQATSIATGKIPPCLAEPLDKLLNAVFASSLKLIQMEACLHSQSATVDQLASRLEVIADNTQHLFMEIKNKMEELKLESNAEFSKKLPEVLFVPIPKSNGIIILHLVQFISFLLFTELIKLFFNLNYKSRRLSLAIRPTPTMTSLVPIPNLECYDLDSSYDLGVN